MAAFWTVILKNNSGGAITLEEFGVVIGNTENYIISDFFDYSDIADSKELDVLVGMGNAGLVINDGTVDLSIVDGINYIKRDNVHNDLKTHYTKAELNVPNVGVDIHWGNIINAPSFGSPVWTEPVSFMITEQSNGAPVGGTLGDIYFDTSDGHFYKHDGAGWNTDLGSASTNQRVIDTSDNNIYTFDGSVLVDGGAVADDAAVMVGDDGDGKNAQYVYSTEAGGSWIKIADVDFEDHLNGTSDKHKDTEITVVNSYDDLGITGPTDLASALTAMDIKMDTALDNNTLGTAYNEGGNGIGRTIDAISGSVKIDVGATGANAPLELTPRPLPLAAASDAGQIAVFGDLLYIFDAGRSKWLSVQRQILVFGRRGKTKDQYLNFSAGTLASNNSGYRLPRKAVIVSMTAQVDKNTTDIANFSLRSNDIVGNDETLSIPLGLRGSSTISTDYPYGQDDYLQAFLGGNDSVEDPMFIVEIAWTV